MIKKNEIKEKLQFGTGGVRGVLGEGALMFNAGTINNVLKALLSFFNINDKNKLKVIIAYDTRYNSDLFSKTAAAIILEAGGFPLVFDKPVPTPTLSYAVRYYKADAGIVITASHNPSEYNGIKLYLQDGGQLVSPEDKVISDLYNSIPWEHYDMVKNISDDFMLISDDFLNKYIKKISEDVNDFIKISYEDIKLKKDHEIKIAYTPLYGTGINTVPKIIEMAGAVPVILKKQANFNSDFPGMEAPNPENESVMENVVRFAKENGCVAAISTDPDCDRLGLAFIDEHKKVYQLTGNELSALFLDFLIKFSSRPGDFYIVNSIVSTDLIQKIAESNNIKCIRTLTGFKYVGKEIKNHLASKKGEFLFGSEESFGFLIGSSIRDKDATQASYLTCLLIKDLLMEKQTPYERLNDIQHKYGFYSEKLIAIKCIGTDNKLISVFMEILRDKSEEIYKEYFSIANKKNFLLPSDFKRIIDFKEKETIVEFSKEVNNYSVENSDVFVFSGVGWRVTIRPSGTEPKIKFYLMSFSAPNADSSCEDVKKRLQILNGVINKLKDRYLN